MLQGYVIDHLDWVREDALVFQEPCWVGRQMVLSTRKTNFGVGKVYLLRNCPNIFAYSRPRLGH